MPNTRPLGMGALPSPADYRYNIASAAAATTAPAAAFALPIALDTKLAPVMMQAQTPSCVAHSVVENYKLWWFRKTGNWVDFSPRFIDILCKRYDNQDRSSGGTYPSLAFKLVCLYGCATTATLPNNTNLPTVIYRDDALLTDEVMADAAAHKMKNPGYVSVPVDFNKTREAIALYGAISSLMLIGNEFWTPSWNDADIDPLRVPDVVVSGHQMTPKGWVTDELNLIRNQWSSAWANNGEAKYNFNAWAPFTLEQWRFAEIPVDVLDMLKTLPAAKDFHYQWNENLEQGMHNDDVKFLQIAYMILGYLTITDPVQLGWFGPKTTLANYKFQIASGISPTSPHNTGPATRVALNALFKL